MLGQSQATLYLDPHIRDWVLFPITLVMVLIGVLRQHVTVLMASQPKKMTRAAIREQRALMRSQVLRQSSTFSPIPRPVYRSLSQYLAQSLISGAYLKDGPPAPNTENKPPNPLSDPAAMDGMMDGMKKQMAMMLPQMVIMGWINFFFQGFVLIRLPFPLTLGFKSMLQRGVETQEMDARWVSSLSWYFLNFFGLNGLFRLLFGGDNAADSSRDMLASPYIAGQQSSGQPQDFVKLFKSEKDNLDLAQGLYQWSGEDIETRVLQRWGKLPKGSPVIRKI